MKVVLDTNACLMPFTESFDIKQQIEATVGQCELIVPELVRIELTTLSHQGGATGRAAAGALRMFKNEATYESELPGDDGLMDICEETGAMLLTNDKALLKEARKRGIGTLQKRSARLMATGIADR